MIQGPGEVLPRGCQGRKPRAGQRVQERGAGSRGGVPAAPPQGTPGLEKLQTSPQALNQEAAVWRNTAGAVRTELSGAWKRRLEPLLYLTPTPAPSSGPDAGTQVRPGQG